MPQNNKPCDTKSGANEKKSGVFVANAVATREKRVKTKERQQTGWASFLTRGGKKKEKGGKEGVTVHRSS